jgi:EAL domain-containing protein (putative c-di-GMP-specific phosphodiesterase class I)
LVSSLGPRRSPCELGHQLGLRVVAEGAENTDTVTALTALGCDTVQGYVFTPPLTADDTHTWIRAHTNHRQPKITAN